MSTIRNLSGAPESPRATGRTLFPAAVESPRGGRRGSRMTHLARTFSKHHGAEDSEGEDELPPRLTFDDDAAPAFPSLPCALFPVRDAGESKDEELREYWRDREQEEREAEAREEGRPPPAATEEGRERQAERESDETEGSDGRGEREAAGTAGVVSGSGKATTKMAHPKVSFSDSVMESDGGDTPSHRPSIDISNLPSATHWETKDGGGPEGGGGGPPAASPATQRHGPAARQHLPPSPPPSLLAKLNPFDDLSWSLVGKCIVRTAPCCWCAKRKLGASPTDRDLLLRLNRLCAFFCAVQVVMGVCAVLLKTVRYSAEEDVGARASNPDADKPLISMDLWSLSLLVILLSLIGLVLLGASVLAQRAIRDVNLVGSVRFMWILFWLLPLQIFCMIGLFDTYNVNMVTIKHWWDDPLFKSIRNVFCETGTADGKCMVPIGGGSIYDDETAWCVAEHDGNTDCVAIRNDAQNRWNVASTVLFTANGIWAALLLVLMWVILNLLQVVITLPIVIRSKEGNVPLWLTVPIVGCYAAGYVLVASDTDSFTDINWIATAFLVDGVLFTLAAGLGLVLKFYTVLNGRQRRIKQGIVVAFLGTIMLTIFGVATIFVASLIYSLQIVDLPSDENLREIACSLDLRGSCTGCDPNTSFSMCPEWTNKDVQSVLETIMKQVATIAAIFIVYAMMTLRYGFVFLDHVSRYQIEYV